MVIAIDKCNYLAALKKLVCTISRDHYNKETKTTAGCNRKINTNCSIAPMLRNIRRQKDLNGQNTRKSGMIAILRNNYLNIIT